MNHVYVNSRRIDQGGSRIKPGDIITLGDTVLKVVLISHPSENQE